MQLPSNEIGISDILDYRQCAQRFGWSMRRHVPLPERFQLYPGEKAEPPESTDENNAYGSAIHDAIAVVEKTQCGDEEAIDAVWGDWQHWLEPEDIDRMKADLATYRTRTETGYRLVGAELELRMPLFVHDGVQIYFRGRIDAIYQRIDAPDVFLTRDYKSSRHKKSAEQIRKDPQQWSYNLLVHENFPECRTLDQLYDQLRFGYEVIRKSAEQREQIRSWLIREVKAILGDTKLKPTTNDFCQYCPLLMDCRNTHLSTDFWKNRLAALAPERKEGRKVIVALTEEHAGFDIYTELLPKAKIAQKVLERYIDAVEDVLKRMPQEQREELGYTLGKGRRTDYFTADALRRVREMVGDDFVHLVKLTKAAVDDFYGDGSEQAEAIKSLATTGQGSQALRPKSQ